MAPLPLPLPCLVQWAAWMLLRLRPRVLPMPAVSNVACATLRCAASVVASLHNLLNGVKVLSAFRAPSHPPSG